jgi:hypothetical protein
MIQGDAGAAVNAALHSASQELEAAEGWMTRPEPGRVHELMGSLERSALAMSEAERLLRTAGGLSGPDRVAFATGLAEWRRRVERLEVLGACGLQTCLGWAAAAGIESGYTADGTQWREAGGAFQLDRSL